MEIKEKIRKELDALENSELNLKMKAQLDKLDTVSDEIFKAEKKKADLMAAAEYDNAVAMEKQIEVLRAEEATISKIVASFSGQPSYQAEDIRRIYKEIQDHYDAKDKEYREELLQVIQKAAKLIEQGHCLKEEEDNLFKEVSKKTDMDSPVTNRAYYSTPHYISMKTDLERILYRAEEVHR